MLLSQQVCDIARVVESANGLEPTPSTDAWMEEWLLRISAYTQLVSLNSKGTSDLEWLQDFDLSQCTISQLKNPLHSLETIGSTEVSNLARACNISTPQRYLEEALRFFPTSEAVRDNRRVQLLQTVDSFLDGFDSAFIENVSVTDTRS